MDHVNIALRRVVEKTRRAWSARRGADQPSASTQGDGGLSTARPLRIGYIQAANETDLQLYRPLAFGYLKAYTEKYLDHPVDIRFLDNLDDVADMDIIGISANSQVFARAMEIARQIKQKKSEVITILGGHHVTYLPETLSPDFDFGVLGEGEQTFLELVSSFCRDGLQAGRDDLRSIDGIAFHDDGHVVTTKPRALIEQLDTLPFPYREQGHVPYIHSSRGCPYKCAYCAGSAFWSRTRFFSAEYVVDEVEHILATFPGRRYIPVWDDLFVANKPRFRKIVDLIEQRNLADRVTFSFSVRANLVDDELATNLKRMNVCEAGFGAESASDRILQILAKGTTVETNQRAIDILHRHGFLVKCSFIVGAPTETEEDVRMTYDFIIKNISEGKLDAKGNYVNILMPLPGTPMWDHAIKAGLIDVQTMDWNRLTLYASYRNSTIDDFAGWVDARRRSNSIYLAEDTLPQERLYELMYTYEGAIRALAEKP